MGELVRTKLVCTYVHMYIHTHTHTVTATARQAPHTAAQPPTATHELTHELSYINAKQGNSNSETIPAHRSIAANSHAGPGVNGHRYTLYVYLFNLCIYPTY
jgi:hypothetical protein